MNLKELANMKITKWQHVVFPIIWVVICAPFVIFAVSKVKEYMGKHVTIIINK